MIHRRHHVCSYDTALLDEAVTAICSSPAGSPVQGVLPFMTAVWWRTPYGLYAVSVKSDFSVYQYIH